MSKVIATAKEGLLIGELCANGTVQVVVQPDGGSFSLRSKNGWESEEGQPERTILYFHRDEYRRWLLEQLRQLPPPK